MDTLRYDYMKDLVHLREYMFQKEVRNSTMDYVDVRFFEATSDLDERTQAIINEKVSAIGMRFNAQIHKLRQTNDIYFRQISLFQ